MLRVLFLVDAVFDDKPGGSRVVARELGRGLAERGHEVTFLVPRHTPDAPEEECSEGVRIVRYAGAGRAAGFVRAGRAAGFVRAGRAAGARLWAEQPFDVVHTHFAYAALGPLKAVPQRIPQVRTFYGPWDAEGWVEDCARLAAQRSAARPQRGAVAMHNRLKRFLRRGVEAANLRRSQAVVVLSGHSQKEVVSFGYPEGRIRKIAGGVDVARFKPPADKRGLRSTLGLPDDCHLLLSVRRLAPRMGLDHLIRAMPAVVARHPNTQLLIVGKGPDRGRLEQIITATGMVGQVRLVGFIPDGQLAGYYQTADLFVLPTLALEGFGLVTVESLACGTPVVGTPVGATPEILGELDPRLITRGVSAGALADGILAFLESDWAKGLTADKLHRFVQGSYTWDRHVAAVEALYEQVIAEAQWQQNGERRAFPRSGARR